MHAEALKFIGGYVTGPLFTPPSLKDDPVTGAPNAVAIPVNWTNSSFKGDGNWRIDNIQWPDGTLRKVFKK